MDISKSTDITTDTTNKIYYLSGKTTFKMQVSVSANAKLYEKVREDESMCQALRELMNDVIEEEIAEERADERRKTTVEVTANTKLDAIKKMMKNLKLTAIQAMQALEIPESEQGKYSALL